MTEYQKVLITGPPQSGKTQKLAECIKECIVTHSVVLIIRNLITDKGQLENKLKKLSNFKIHDDVVKFENYSGNSVLIIQWNKTQLTKTNNAVNRQFFLFTDESDDIGYKNPGIVSDLYEELKTKSNGHYEVTATPWDVLYGNDDLDVKNVLIVKPPENFRGIDDYVYSQYEISSKNDINDIINDYYISKAGDNFCSQPAIILHKNGNRQSKHTDFIMWIAGHDTFKTIYTVIVEDGRGFQLYCPQLESDGIITINGVDYKETEENSNYFNNISNKNLDIQELLQWLKTSNIMGITHIIIKTGNQAGRSRSYVSADGQWHLTHQFLYNSRDIPIPDLIQGLRLSHTLGGNNTLELTAPVKTIKDIKKGNNAINKALKIITESADKSTCKKMLLAIKWNIEEIPNAKLCKSPLHKDMNKNMVKKNRSLICTKKYTVLDLTKLNNTKLRRGIEHLYYSLDKLMEKSKKTSLTVDVKTINEKLLSKWYLSENKDTITSKLNDRVHGAIWTPIRTSNFFDDSNEPVPNFINYYTSKDGVIRIIYKKS